MIICAQTKTNPKKQENKNAEENKKGWMRPNACAKLGA